MRKRLTDTKCMRCGGSFTDVATYEAHLEQCYANPAARRSAFIARRLREVADELK